MQSSTEVLPPHLQSDSKIHIIISILSGSHNAENYHNTTLKPLLDSKGLEYSTHVTQSTQTIIELTKGVLLPNALKAVKQTILLLSGDGGLIDIVDTLASSLQKEQRHLTSAFVKPVVCLIPQGTANALAWSSTVAHDPLAVLTSGKAKSLPIFEVTLSSGSRLVTNEGADRESIPILNGHPRMYGAVVLSWGIHASLVARSDTAEYRKHGIERFKMAAHELLVENHAYSGEVSIKTRESRSWQPLKLPNANLSHGSSSAGSSSTNGEEDEDEASNISLPSPRSSAGNFISNDNLDTPNPLSSSSSSSPQSQKIEPLSYLAATLVSNFEEKYLISPHTKPLSGSLYLISMPHAPAPTIASLTHLPYENGQHLSDPRVGYQEITDMKIDFREDGDDNDDAGQWRQVCVDGKIVEVEKNGWVVLKRVPTDDNLPGSEETSSLAGGIVDVVVPFSLS